IVFRDDLEPVDGRVAVEDFGVMLRPEAEAESEKGGFFHDALRRGFAGAPERARPGGCQLLSSLPPLASHSALLSDRKPWPLQEFWPLQELEAVAHSLWPLQELTPAHLTVSSAALAE